MDMTTASCREFVQVLASAAPTPGGGGAAALVGAIGTALGSMVGALTVGKKIYAAVEEELQTLMLRAAALQTELLELVERDAEGFAPLAKAYGIPRDDPNRAEILEQATIGACAAPLRMMAVCCEALELIRVFAEKGSRLAVSDAGCAAVCCKAALQSAALNVLINTKSLKNRALAEQYNATVETHLTQYGAMADAIFTAVRDNF